MKRARSMAALRKTNLELLQARDGRRQPTGPKSEFVANMSHELRTPMNGIMGMTDVVLETQLTTEQRDYLTTVRTCTDSLLTVINDVLDFSKIEAGKLDIDPIRFNIREMLAETIKASALRAHEKNLRLAWDIRPAVPVQMIGDPGRLRQIIVNLLGNAIKFTAQGGGTRSVVGCA